MQEVFPQTARRLEEWKSDPKVLGVLLVGSKSRGYGDELSDDDLEVILTDESHSRLSPAATIEFLFVGEGESRRTVFDAYYTSLSDLRSKAASARDLDHWPYEAARVLFDRDGRVGAAVEAAAKMAPEFRRARLLHGTVDAGVAFRRASKTSGRGMEGAGRLIVSRGARALVRVVFALEWRWAPLDHWLEPALRGLPNGGRFADRLGEALLSGSSRPLAEELEELEERLHAEGVPRTPDRLTLFLELIHPSRAEERALHGLP